MITNFRDWKLFAHEFYVYEINGHLRYEILVEFHEQYTNVLNAIVTLYISGYYEDKRLESGKCYNRHRLVDSRPLQEALEVAHRIGYFSGMRMFEGGKREMIFQNRISSGDKRPCTHVSGGITSVSPIFDWTDDICEEFIQKYNAPLSRAYTEYGEERTGCFLCPYGLDVDKRLEVLHTYEPNHYKAALYFLKDVYIAQGVELPFDEDYMREYKEQWIKYEPMRYEMLKRYRPDCMICKKYEKEHGQPAQKKLF